ncbi:MAG: hypothetical protein PUD72_05935 [Oscillospiraceae bacterium]|nr:hypothetical protein [Oscillospiraceae bacterium]
MESTWILLLCFVPLLFLLFYGRKKKKTDAVIIKKIIKNKKGRGNTMSEFIKEFIGKTCAIHTIDNALDFDTHIIKDVTDTAVLCETKKGKKVLVNLDYITAIEEIPEKKK